MGETFLTRYFQSEECTPMFQIIFAFVYGVLLSPWSSGIFFLVVFALIYEIIFYLFTFGDPRYWQSETRVSVVAASFFGWIIGRTVYQQDVLKSGIPTISTMFNWSTYV